jgi:hypothetical protein
MKKLLLLLVLSFGTYAADYSGILPVQNGIFANEDLQKLKGRAARYESFWTFMDLYTTGEKDLMRGESALDPLNSLFTCAFAYKNMLDIILATADDDETTPSSTAGMRGLLQDALNKDVGGKCAIWGASKFSGDYKTIKKNDVEAVYKQAKKKFLDCVKNGGR